MTGNKHTAISSDDTTIFDSKISGGQEFFTVDEASSYLRVTKATLYKWIFQRKIPYRKHGRKVIFNKRELDEWSKSQSYAPASVKNRNETSFRRS